MGFWKSLAKPFKAIGKGVGHAAHELWDEPIGKAIAGVGAAVTAPFWAPFVGAGLGAAAGAVGSGLGAVGSGIGSAAGAVGHGAGWLGGQLGNFLNPAGGFGQGGSAFQGPPSPTTGFNSPYFTQGGQGGFQLGDLMRMTNGMGRGGQQQQGQQPLSYMSGGSTMIPSPPPMLSNPPSGLSMLNFGQGYGGQNPYLNSMQPYNMNMGSFFSGLY